MPDQGDAGDGLMDRDALRDLLTRLGRLERYLPRYRQGVVTDDNPLSVALGGSDVSYTSVRTIAPGLAVDDVVAVLVIGNDLIVLGRVQGNTPDWQTVSAFSNSWTNFDAPRAARYYRRNGRVYLEGLIKSGTVGSVAFVLPAGYRPVDTISFPVDANGAFGAVAVYANGNVVPYVGSNAAVYLYSISFAAAG